MIFVETVEGPYINTAHIRRIRPPKLPEARYVAITDDNKSYTLVGVPEWLLHAGGLNPVIPAALGFFRLMLLPGPDVNVSNVVVAPIIGWQRGTYGMTPVTPDGWDCEREYVVEYPDGRVLDLDGGQRWPSRKEWFEYEIEAWRKREAKKAAEKAA